MKKITLIFALIVSLTILFTTLSGSLLKQAEGQTSTSVNLTNLSHNGKSSMPQILSSGNNIYLAWLNGDASNGNVTFAKSSDGGVTFSNPIIIPSVVHNQMGLELVSSGNNVYLLWRQYEFLGNNGIPQIYFAKSNDAGNTFSNPVNLSNGTNIDLGTSAIASGNNLYFTWARSNNILFSKSTDAGNTFSSPVNLYGNNINNGLALPNIAMSNSNICILGISGSQVLFTKSTDNGATFNTPITIGTTASSNPQIVTNGNYVYLSWVSSTGAVLFSQSSDSGSTFSTPVTVDNTGAQQTPHIAVSGNNVYLTWDKAQIAYNAWDKYYPAHNDVMLAKSTDGGSSFKIYRIDTAFIAAPQILASNNNLYLIWQSASNNYPVFLATSNDGGNTLSAPTSLGQAFIDSVYPQMSLSSDTPYLTLEENGDIFFTKISNSLSLNNLFTLQPLGTTISIPLAQNQTIQINENTPSSFILNTYIGQQTYDKSISYYVPPKIVNIGGGSVDTYAYSIVNPPKYGNLTGSPPKLTYTPIHGYVSTRYPESFTFKANDGKSDSNIATVSIQVSPTINTPTANAGTDQTVISNSPVTLNGTGSIDPDYNTFLKWTWNPSTPKPTIDQFIKYSWIQTAGQTVTLSNKTISNPTFIAPTVTSPTSLTFVLTVSKYSNPQPLSDSSSVTITVNPLNTQQPSAQSSTSSITVSTDKSSYSKGDTITIFGKLSSPVSNHAVTIEVLNSFQNPVYVASLAPESDGSITAKLLANGTLWQTSGTYTIMTQYNSTIKNLTTFYFNSANVTPSSSNVTNTRSATVPTPQQTSPQSNQIQPLNQVTSAAITNATLQYFGQIESAKYNHTIAAEVYLGNQSIQTKTIDNNITVQTNNISQDSINVIVSASNQTSPKVLLFNLGNTTINIGNLKYLGIMYDGKPIQPASDVNSLLHGKSTDDPKYAIIITQSGAQILVLVPHFSTHNITITNMSKVIPAVPEFPFAVIVLIIATFSIVLIPKMKRLA